MLNFAEMSIALNIGLFVAAGVVVWFAGARVSRLADAISEKTGLGHALLGLLLLAGVTSLPEIGVTISAAVENDVQLAMNNLFGSIAMQVAILAVIDFVASRRALTSVIPEPGVMLQGVLNVFLLSIAIAGMVAGDVAVFGVGLWSWACLIGYVGSVWLLSQTEGRRPWLAADGKGRPAKKARRQVPNEGSDRTSKNEYRDRSLATLISHTVAAAAAILVSGYILSRTGSAIAEQTGIGSSFVGFFLVAISTSLPEFSTALAAARLGRFTMAISDILGTNLINVGLVFLVDVAAPGEPVLARADAFSIFGAALGIAMTAIFVAGLAERRDRTVFRMGIDSVAVLVIYFGGLAILFSLRGAS